MAPPAGDPAPVRSTTTDRARRAEILATAAELIASSGMRTSLGQIADACGIRTGSLYHHFASKEAILVELIGEYRTALDRVADRAHERLTADAATPLRDQIAAFAADMADCARRHRAALLLTFYEPPSGAGDDLVRAAEHTMERVTAVALDLLRTGDRRDELRPGLPLEALADRLCQAMLHISLGLIGDVPGGDQVPQVRCHILLDGIAPRTPSNRALDRSAALKAAQRTFASWDEEGDEDGERFAALRSAARTEFGRKGYEATTMRDIASAAGLSTGAVYRLVGSKDELLERIMGTFVTKARESWRAVLVSDSTPIEMLDALMWTNVNLVDRFSDEFNIQVAWLRESPPTSLSLGGSFTARLRDLKSVLAAGRRAGTLEIPGASSDVRAWSLFELLWMPENIVQSEGPRAALDLARDTVLRGTLRH